MELPDDVVQIIKDYSRPMTRPDWRRLHKMSYQLFHLAVLERYNTRFYNLVLHFHENGKHADFMYIVFNTAFNYSMNKN
jgi:hypothetical protein